MTDDKKPEDNSTRNAVADKFEAMGEIGSREMTDDKGAGEGPYGHKKYPIAGGGKKHSQSCQACAYAEGRKSVQIKTPCPSCGFTTLCVDDSGNLVCSFLECKNPTEIANKEGRKAAEKEFKELLEMANEASYFNQDIMGWRMKYADWKKARGIE